MKTTWARLHPFTQWLYYGISLLLAMLLFHPLFLFIGILILTGFHFCAFMQFRLGSFYRIAFFATFLFTLINPFFSQRGSYVLFTIQNQIFFLEPILYGMTLGLSLSMILLIFRLYQDLFSSSLFLSLFHRLSSQWSLLLMLSIRFVPMFQRRVNEIRLSQIHRYKGSATSWKEKGKRIESIMCTLLSWSLEDALQTVDSMKARGYGSSTKRSNFHYHHLTKKDQFLCSWMSLLLIIQVYLWFIGYGRLQIYPWLKPIFPSYMEYKAILCMCLFLGTPFWYKGVEHLRWIIWKFEMRHLHTRKEKIHP